MYLKLSPQTGLAIEKRQVEGILLELGEGSREHYCIAKKERELVTRKHGKAWSGKAKSGATKWQCPYVS